MDIIITPDQLTQAGLPPQAVASFINTLQDRLQCISDPESAWQEISQTMLTADHPFPLHKLLFTLIYPHWHQSPDNAPAYLPTQAVIENANITRWMHELSLPDVKSFHHWTAHHYTEFWQRIIDKLQIVLRTKPSAIVDLSQGIESPNWLPGAKLNIAESCFTAPRTQKAILFRDQNDTIQSLSYEELNKLSNRIANSLLQLGLSAGEAIGIAMPMNYHAVAIYLGIIKMGGVVVSIADSFSAQEISTRLRIAKVNTIFTQDYSVWMGKPIPLYEKVASIRRLENLPPELSHLKIIVAPHVPTQHATLDPSDHGWHDFLVADDQFEAVPCDPMTPCNILFSSGTTGEPKAIVWNHTTPIKAASDAYFHQNIKSNEDILAWPTNLGWMMGPWLIFAGLINQATLAIYSEAPKERRFGEFIEQAKVTLLGVVPTLVAAWRLSACMEKLDWSSIKVFASTGECSNPEDMLYLMSLAGYKPVIEYCGGTEIGGAYISSTTIEKNYPSLFTTPTMGLDFTIINEEGEPTDMGEVAIIPPSIGLSTVLLNADHDQVYFATMSKNPDGRKLRRHGDQIQRYPSGCFSILGRVDDTMNLGGIKTSSAEIERVLTGFSSILEVAAIAVTPKDNGPSQLIVFASSSADVDKQTVLKDMQKKINSNLNPLFKIADLILMKELPKTASNKIMRRELRKHYQET